MASKIYEVEDDGSDFEAILSKAMGSYQQRTCGLDKSLFDIIPRHILEPLPNRAYRIAGFYLEFESVDTSDTNYVNFRVSVRKPKQLRLF